MWGLTDLTAQPLAKGRASLEHSNVQRWSTLSFYHHRHAAALQQPSRPLHRSSQASQPCCLCLRHAQQDAPAPFKQAAQKLAAGVAAALIAASCQGTPLAQAVLNSPNANIPRTVDSALRRSIPAFNEDVLSIQKRLEDIAYKLRIPQRKPWDAMSKDVSKATALITQRDKALYGVLPEQEQQAGQLADDILNSLRSLQTALDNKEAEKTSTRVTKALNKVAELELLQAPGLAFSIPKEYSSLPRLTGRATVQLNIEKGNGSATFLANNGKGPSSAAQLTIVLDGYSAPLTAGNFAAEVLNGSLNNRRLDASYTSVLAQAAQQGADVGRTLPLEIMPAGSFDPLYHTHLDVSSGELPVLPLSIYGALAMAHPPDGLDGDSSASEFFFYKFAPQSSGLAGLSFDEGNFGVFGYVTQGSELLPQLQSGDVISNAKLLSGQDRLLNVSQG